MSLFHFFCFFAKEEVLTPIALAIAIDWHEQERPSLSRKSGLRLRNPFRSSPHPPPLTSEDSEQSGGETGSGAPPRSTYRGSSLRNLTGSSFRNLVSPGRGMHGGLAPQSDTLKGFRSFYEQNTRQYTIASKTKYVSVSRWTETRIVKRT